MSKIGYILNRIKKMDYSNFFKTVKMVHQKTNKSSIIIFFDIIKCGFRYQAGYMDYQLFEMYNMNDEERKTVITRGINNEIIKKYNNKEYFKFFQDKVLFNQKFDKYIMRDWIYLNGDNLKEFKEFLKGKDEIMVKPISGTCGKGVSKIKIKNTKIEKLYNKIIADGTPLCEEVAIQCDEISRIHPSSINTCRVVTLNGHVVVAFLRIGNKGNVVDNFNHEGLVVPIDIKDGKIKFRAIDKKHNEYEEHPYTGQKIVGVQIPKWEKVKKLCEKASKEIPEIGYVGWDVCVGVEKPFLIEGNEFPGHDLYQLPPHRKSNVGLLPIFKKAMEDNDEKTDYSD